MASSRTKTCTKCGESKDRSAFAKRKKSLDGLQLWCKVCFNASQRKKYKDPVVRKRISEQGAAYRQTEEAKKKRRISENARGYTDWGKLKNKLGTRLHHFAICKHDTPLNRGTMGCTLAEIRAHIEKQFKDGMSWENYHDGVWEFDHDVPYGAFPTVEELEDYHKVVCWYKNVQPLLKPDNIRKGKKCPPEKKYGVLSSI